MNPCHYFSSIGCRRINRFNRAAIRKKSYNNITFNNYRGNTHSYQNVQRTFHNKVSKLLSSATAGGGKGGEVSTLGNTIAKECKGKVVNEKSSNSNNFGNSSTDTLGILIFGSLCVGTFYLGCWQTSRYFQKIDGMEERKNQLQLLPMRKFCSKTFIETPYRRYCVRGEFLYDKEVFVGPRPLPDGVLPPNPKSGTGGGGLASNPQGYFVVTPFRILSHHDDNDRTSAPLPNEQHKKEELESEVAPPELIMVNRGWIPKEFAPKEERKNDRRAAASRRGIQRNDNKKHDSATKVLWEQSKGCQEIVLIPSDLEEPKIFAIENNIHSKILFYMDKIIFQSIIKGLLANNSNSSNNKYHSNAVDDNVDNVYLFTQVLKTENISNSDNSKSNKELKFPLQPSKKDVGEFKLTPEIHAGYAVTWYGLSIAGVIMTRKMFTRGR